MKQKEKFARYLLIAVVFDPLFNGVAGDGPYSRNYSLSLTLKGLRVTRTNCGNSVTRSAFFTSLHFEHAKYGFSVGDPIHALN